MRLVHLVIHLDWSVFLLCTLQKAETRHILRQADKGYGQTGQVSKLTWFYAVHACFSVVFGQKVCGGNSKFQNSILIKNKENSVDHD